MVVKTSVGEAYLSDYSRGVETDPVDTIILGTGSAAEAKSNTTDDIEEVHRDPLSNSNVTVVEDETQPGYVEIFARAQGGTEVDAGTTITEVGYAVGAQDILVYRDVQGGLTINAGRTGEVKIPIQW